MPHPTPSRPQDGPILKIRSESESTLFKTQYLIPNTWVKIKMAKFIFAPPFLPPPIPRPLLVLGGGGAGLIIKIRPDNDFVFTRWGKNMCKVNIPVLL